MDSADGQDDQRAYPPSWSTDVVLSDGQTVQVRPITADDAEGLRRFHARQSPESIYFRYFSPRPVLSERDIEHFTNVDHDSRVAFVVISEEEIIAVARYEKYTGTNVAEVAFFVDDAHHGRGIATLLLEYLVAAARERGITRFTATTLPNNTKMLSVFSGAGYDITSNFDSGVIEVGFDIRPTDASVAAMARRERRAQAASVRSLLMPRSIAVIGAGRNRGSIGAEVYLNLLNGDFKGPVYPVNRSGLTVGGEPALVSTDELPDDTDLAVIATPAAEVLSDVEKCGRKGVKALVIVSAGFSESGLEGAQREAEVLEMARTHGMRILGPNCLGILNTDPSVSMDASLSSVMPPAGSVAVLSETGTLAAAMVEHAARLGMGVSTFVAAGNRLDVSASDLLSYWIEDDRTGSVLLSLTGQDSVPRFVRAARSASLAKPIVALNPSSVMRRHRKSIGDVERRAKAMFRQTGVISVGSLSQLFDVGRVLAEQPVPAGPRVAVVGNSDGALMLAAAACRGAGLDLVPLTGIETSGKTANSENPLNLTYQATVQELAESMQAIARSGKVDSLVVVYTPPTLEADPTVNEAILKVSAEHPELTVVATMFGTATSSLLRSPNGESAGVPVFAFPEDAVQVLGRLAAYKNWLVSAEHDQPAEADHVAMDGARELLVSIMDERVGETGLSSGEFVDLDADLQNELLDRVGIAMAERRVVADVEEAVRAADEIGWPVVLKAAVRDRTTRSAASGVTLDIADADHLRMVWGHMVGAIGDRMVPAVVQRFLPNGIDIAVSVVREPTGVGTISVGLGGPARIAGDSEMGVIPLSLADASSLVAASPVAKVLTDPLDRVPVVGLVHALASLAESLDVALEIDADPVITASPQILVADVDIRVGAALDDFTVRRID
ncbi:MAG: GNAT family N-acetyltransferase [Microthrixaceae bacterium]|nr:GNAT family N-acetyltransferase [Microthrixaceae bacterium]